MNTPKNTDHEFDDDLVAYLDGELSSTDRQQVERRLANEPEFRIRLRELQSSWDLLDALPQSMEDSTFTQTTVAMATRDAAGKRASRWLPRRQQLVSIALAAITGLLGFAFVYFPMKQRQNRLLRDLPVAQNIEIYRYADDVEFLQSLYDQDVFRVEETDEY